MCVLDDDCFPRDADGNLELTDHKFTDTWAAMEKVYSSGKVKAIGVSNFSIKTCVFYASMHSHIRARTH